MPSKRVIPAIGHEETTKTAMMALELRIASHGRNGASHAVGGVGNGTLLQE